MRFNKLEKLVKSLKVNNKLFVMDNGLGEILKIKEIYFDRVLFKTENNKDKVMMISKLLHVDIADLIERK